MQIQYTIVVEFPGLFFECGPEPWDSFLFYHRMPFCNVSYLHCGFVPLFTWQHHEDSSALRLPFFFFFWILKCLVRIILKLIRCHAFSICHFPNRSPFRVPLLLFLQISLYLFFYIIELFFMGFSSSFGFRIRFWKGSLRFLVDFQALLTSYRVERTYVCAYVWRVKWWYVAYYCQFLWDFHVWMHSGCYWNMPKWMC